MLASVSARALRVAYRRELVPSRARWWMAAAGLRDWFRWVTRELEVHLEGRAQARSLMSTLVAEMWQRRYVDVRSRWSWLPPIDRGRSLALWSAALYRQRPGAGGGFLWDAVGGGPRHPREWWQAHRLVAPASAEERWREITVHLGEWLIVLTDELPARLPRANAILGDICFRSGVRYAESIARLMGIEMSEPSAPHRPEAAIEVLRMSEYLFRVNPEHESAANGDAGFIAGSACPWHSRPGWQRMHCGIFGQFQSGIASVFGQSYQLTTTIPKHGGDVCRIDLEPLPASGLAKRARSRRRAE